jgi:uncharacterized membrane protein
MKWLLILLVTYILLAVAMLEYENFRLGYNQLESYHKEYEDGGIGKWRKATFDKNNSRPVSNFPTILYLFGLPIYIIAPIGFIISIIHLLINKRKLNKILAIVCFVVFICSFFLYLKQDVWGAIF